MFKNLIDSDFSNLNISYKENTDLGIITDEILKHVFTGKSSSLESLYDDDTLASIESYFTTEKGKEDLSYVRDLGTKLADTYQYNLDILKEEVAPEVDRLVELINNTTKMYMDDALGFENLDKNPTPVLKKFSYIDFSNLPDQLNYPEYRYQITRKYIENNKDFKIDKYNIRYIFDQINNYNDIKLSDEVKNNILELYSFNNENKELASNHIEDLFSANKIYNYKSSLYYTGLSDRKLNGTVINNAREFISIYPTLNALSNYVELSSDSMNLFRENMDTLEDLYKLSCIILDLSKDQYKDSLIIDSTMINSEMLEEFQLTGGSVTDIHNYLRLHHNDNKDDILYLYTVHEDVPSVGIKMNNVLFNIPSDREHLDELQTKVKDKLEEVKNTSTKLAFENVLKSYIQDIEDNHPEMILNKNPNYFHTQALALINTATRELMTNKYSNVYDNVYTFYLNLKYPNTLVSTIHEKMSSLLIQKNSLEDNPNTNEVMFEVMTDIISSFVGKTMLA